MMKVLFPVDGSDRSNHAIDRVVTRMPWLLQGSEVHLLNVQSPVPGGSRVASLIGHDKLKQYHHDEGMKALQPAVEKFAAAGVPAQYHIVVGDPAVAIAEFAKEKGIDEIVIGTHGHGAASLFLGSVAMKLIPNTEVPVLLVK